MKKLLSILLAVAMMFSLGVSALADGTATTITSTDSGSNSLSHGVTASYTPEARWGASADNLPNSGTLIYAKNMAKSDSSIKYIQLQKDISGSSDCGFTGGVFTLDLNGFTRTTTYSNAITVSGDSTDVILTDTNEGKTGGLKTTNVLGKAISVTGGKLTIQYGSFTSAGDYALEVKSGTVAVQGGSYGSAATPVGVWGGTLTVTGGSFTHGTSGASFAYDGGKLDLSGYPTEAKEGTTPLTDIKVMPLSAVTVSDTTIKLPEGYAFYDVTDTTKATVTGLVARGIYGIKSTSGGTTTTDEAKWGTSKDSLTESGTLEDAFVKAKDNSSIKYIQLQKDLTITSSYKITGGTFTLDLNGKAVSSSDNEAFYINGGTADVTFTDTATGGKVECTSTSAIRMNNGKLTITGGSYSGKCALFMYSPSATVTATIKGGTFTSTDYYTVDTETGSILTIEGGTFTAGESLAVAVDGTVTITGGSFTAGKDGHIGYWGGTLDLSGYTGTIAGLTVKNGAYDAEAEELVYLAVPVVGHFTLPSGYGFSADGTTTVDTLAENTTYSIISTSGGTETETVAITGMAIKIDDVTYDSSNTSQSNPAKIGPDSTVTLVARGTNLNNATANNKVIEGPSRGALSIVGWTCNADNTEATNERKASIFGAVINAFQLQYSNDGGTTWIDSGVWIVYEDLNPPTITGVSVTVGGQTYTSGTVTITPNSGDVTITVKGTNLDRATTMNIIQCAWNDVGRKVMSMATDSDGNRYITLSPTDFTANTTAFNVSYSNSGATTKTDIHIVYQSEIISVGIAWGSLSFNYSDAQESGADKGWSPAADGANKITVTNSSETDSTTALAAVPTYTQAADYSGITGKFVDAEGAEIDETNCVFASAGSKDFYLVLSGKPSGTLTDAAIGSVTITLTRGTIS